LILFLGPPSGIFIFITEGEADISRLFWVKIKLVRMDIVRIFTL